jgi:hypothetical protein
MLARVKPGAVGANPHALREPRTESEKRVLCYLATNLSVAEIAGELEMHWTGRWRQPR